MSMVMFLHRYFMMQDLDLSHLYSLSSLLVFSSHRGLEELFSGLENGL